jgi:hypothetical protein
VRRAPWLLTSIAVLGGIVAAPALAAKSSRAPKAPRANPRTGRLAPALTELVQAAKRGDRAALGRVADRLGPAKMSEAIANPTPGVGEAALAAVPLARGGVRLMAAVANELGTADHARAAAAATALGGLLDASVPTELEDWEVPPDVVARACSGLAVLAWRAGAPASARLAALDAIAAAAPTCGVPTEIMGLARDPLPAIRRATVLLGANAEWRESALRDAIADADKTVSAAGTAAACRVEGRVGRGGKTEAPTSAALASARSLAVAPATPPEDAVEMLDCLAGAADRGLLDQLQRRPASALRDRAVELVDPRAKPP